LSGNVLYGTTYGGGSWDCGTIFKINTDGTGYTLLKNFTDAPDGAYPHAALTLSGSVLYGTTYGGGSLDRGTIFKMNTDGTGYNVLKNFTDIDGAYPYAELMLSGNSLYGTTSQGGSLGNGTVYKLDLSAPILLTIQSLGNAVLLSWTNSTFALQAAPFVTGTYTNIPGATSSYTNSFRAARRSGRTSSKG